MTRLEALQLLQKQLSQMTAEERKKLQEAMKLVSKIRTPVS
jgi:hypothetical protein